jgi:hypothetical protein
MTVNRRELVGGSLLSSKASFAPRLARRAKGSGRSVRLLAELDQFGGKFFQTASRSVEAAGKPLI